MGRIIRKEGVRSHSQQRHSRPAGTGHAKDRHWGKFGKARGSRQTAKETCLVGLEKSLVVVSGGGGSGGVSGGGGKDRREERGSTT